MEYDLKGETGEVEEFKGFREYENALENVCETEDGGLDFSQEVREMGNVLRLLEEDFEMVRGQ